MFRVALAVVTLIGISSVACGETPAAGERLALEFVPPDVTAVLSVRPAEMAGREEFRDLTRLADSTALTLTESKLSSRDIREVMLIKYGELDRGDKLRTIIRFVEPRHQQQFVETLERKFYMKKGSNSDVWEGDSGWIVKLDDRTLVSEHKPARGEQGRLGLKNKPPRWAAAWQERKDRPVVFAVDVKAALRKNSHVMQAFTKEMLGEQTFGMFYPLVWNVDWLVGGVELGEKVRISGVVQSDGEKTVQNVRDTLNAALVTLRNVARIQFVARGDERGMRSPREIEMEIHHKLMNLADKLLENAESKVEGTRVNVTLASEQSTKELASMIASMAPAITEARAAARQMQNINNLKQIGLGLLNYHDTRRNFPAAVSFAYRANGQAQRSKYPHSWRIDVLPYLEEATMYEQYRFDEPWDSEANKKVLANMPAVFRSPHDPDPKSTNTSYFVFTGPETIFDGEKQVGYKNITDGTSRTIMVVEAKRAVPWTKPEDIEYAADKPIPKLGGWLNGEFVAITADCAAHRVSTEIDEATLRAYITKGGGEVPGDLLRPVGK